MEFGISSIGFVNEFRTHGNFSNSIEILLKATEECLKYAEENGIKICEIMLEHPAL